MDDMPNATKNENSTPFTQDKSPIQAALLDVYHQFRDNSRGKLADYIPELAKANPNDFGISMVTVDGKIYEVGDTRIKFTIQSISKVFLYGLALADHGPDKVLKHVGVEPSGDSFNSIIFDELFNRPFNPMVNAGAIATTALIKGENFEKRQGKILNMLSRFAGHPLEIDLKTLEAEKATGHRNRAIAYLELNSNMIEEPIEDHLNLYFMQCSALVDAKDLAVMAATLANHGVNPLTGEVAQEPEHITYILSVMQSSGMYNFSGEWIFRIGLPAKSGVSGGILVVVPGQLGIGIYSPPLDDRGNSIRGIQVCEALSQNFNLHLFDKRATRIPVIRRFYTDLQILSKRQRNQQELEILQEVGCLIHVYELQGDLFFSSLEQLSRTLSQLEKGPLDIILDVRHVSRVDPKVLSLLTSLRDRLVENEIYMYVSGRSSVLYDALKESENWSSEIFFESLQDALESRENYLISLANFNIDKTEIFPLEKIEMLSNFSKIEIDVIKKYITQNHYSTGEIIFAEGDPPTELYMLAAGVAGLILQISSPEISNKRIGSFSPGITFGELCLFHLGARTANIIAEEPCVCYVLPVIKIDELAKKYPEIYSKVLVNTGKILADRLRRSNEELKILST
ncbi:MAG: glutaminase A [Parachlamydiaceae bacterium]|nr:glutaminase A [Parachlamydiaceae bacterium]